MNGHISCAVPDCNENVIGQCQGYKEPCGRLFCAKHSVKRLCDECAAVQEAERLYHEYEGYARYVTANSLVIPIIIFIPIITGFISKAMVISDPGGAAFLIGFLIGALISIILTIKIQKSRREEINN